MISQDQHAGATRELLTKFHKNLMNRFSRESERSLLSKRKFNGRDDKGIAGRRSGAGQSKNDRL